MPITPTSSSCRFGPPREGAYHGLSGIEAWIADTSEVFDKFDMNFEFTDLGERLLALRDDPCASERQRREWTSKQAASSSSVTERMVRWEDLGSKSKALEAAGLSQ